VKDGIWYDRSVGLYQGADTLGAQHALDLLPILDDRHGLQIGAEDPPGGLLRPGTIVTKGGRFPAIRALCHMMILSFRNET
jgi:hypothetical protein